MATINAIGGDQALSTTNSPTFAALTLTAPLPLASGGSNATLAANTGGILYSTSTAMAILAGTATAQQMLQSGASGAPAWSTTVWPATSAASTLIYTTTANVISSLATANNSILTTNGSGVPGWSTSIPGFKPWSWVDVSSGTQTMTTNTGYRANNGASLVTFTLPTTSAVGDTIAVAGSSSGGWKITYTTSQQIFLSSASSTVTSGNIASTSASDSVTLTCTVANTIWESVAAFVGNIAYA